MHAIEIDVVVSRTTFDPIDVDKSAAPVVRRFSTFSYYQFSARVFDTIFLRTGHLMVCWVMMS